MSMSPFGGVREIVGRTHRNKDEFLIHLKSYGMLSFQVGRNLKASEVAKEFELREEAYLTLRESELGPEDLEDERVKLGVRVVLVGRKRSRTFDLGALTLIYNLCSRDFVKDYLNLDLSLEDVAKRYGTLTELHFLSSCMRRGKVKLATIQELGSKDLVSLLQRLNQFNDS
ncbi:hypothetical protein HS1genome_0118 [Sulfodiicoccus acidiphilus]|uniref:Uncharacterized protein n=1 Tax=Sulfodiicoccus acidiphilus TaxID=1670455 RepID=A0A348B0M7_9CREN|nr:hypothetical protein HS1genome_0118 [Sulfodiicoccus acidiphilus]GGT86285.1 hypothetical protein GCM10007116_00280 [Sulfodiicoccus acidiphilus]